MPIKLVCEICLGSDNLPYFKDRGVCDTCGVEALCSQQLVLPASVGITRQGVIEALQKLKGEDLSLKVAGRNSKATTLFNGLQLEVLKLRSRVAELESLAAEAIELVPLKDGYLSFKDRLAEIKGK